VLKVQPFYFYFYFIIINTSQAQANKSPNKLLCSNLAHFLVKQA